MTCTEALDLVEPIAAGDLEVSDTIRLHFESCPRCAAALASARRIETALSRRSVPSAPEGFTSTVLGRIRLERWRSEQAVDRIFNLGIAVAVVLMAVGVGALLNLNGVLRAASVAWQAIDAASSGSVTVAAPSFAAYVGAVGLFASALAMWWWAERRLSL